MYHQPAARFFAVTREVSAFQLFVIVRQMPCLVITLAASKVGLRAHQVFRRNAAQLQLSGF